MDPDVELIKRSIARDERAFGEIFDRHSTPLYRYAYSLTHDVTEAQELVQETFVTAWRRLADIRLVGESMLPWLLVACRYHAQNLQRSHRRHDDLPLDDEVRASASERLHDDHVAHREELEWVMDAIRQLGEVDRRIVALCLFEGRSYRDAARELGLTVSGLTKRVERTRATLRKWRDEMRDA